MSFSSQIKGWSEKTQKAHNAIFRGSALEIFKSLVKRSPVKEGRFRGNWQVGINSQPSGQLKVADKSGGSTINKGSGAIGKYKNGDVIYFINNMDYSIPLEHGSSKQAPAGMVKITILIWDASVDAKAKGIL